MTEIIVDVITQTPGEFEKPSSQYKGKKYRTVVFLTNYELAQFFEVNKKLVKDWKKGQTHTSNLKDEYASLNLSLKARKFIAAYHDSKKITLNDIMKALKNQCTIK
jgi:hypothetical protein|tara:strand:+ start:372 stop:689 length:318 start_codon:yes stop_codon:yes gene_type:complete